MCLANQKKLTNKLQKKNNVKTLILNRNGGVSLIYDRYYAFNFRENHLSSLNVAAWHGQWASLPERIIYDKKSTWLFWCLRTKRARIKDWKERKKRASDRKRDEIVQDSKKWGQIFFSIHDRSIESDFCEEHPSSVRSLDESISTFQTSRHRLSVALVLSRRTQGCNVCGKNDFIERECNVVSDYQWLLIITWLLAFDS